MKRRTFASAVSLLMLAIGSASAAKDFSAAEKLLFMSEQLHGLKPPATLRYTFRHTGSLEAAFEDTVLMRLQPEADGGCCASQIDFLTGPRKVDVPPIESAKANPVTLGFLERDVREMQRLTQGQPAYFRKRIRIAVVQDATVRDVTLPFRGRLVQGRQISIAPYEGDPNRPRFGRFIDKHYVFTLSAEVPGGVYAIRTQINDPESPDKPLIVDELLADGASAAAARPAP